ncbi:hypothetical protein ACTHGU_01830 [Chitinophagaceae bacterium MMS25-I14]
MKSIHIISIVLIIFSLCSCGRGKNGKAHSSFNEGVALNLQSIEEQDKGSQEQAAVFNRQSVEKFKQTFALDSTYPGIRGALGHSLYIDRQFAEAIRWFDQANKAEGEAAANYREKGLCEINLGKVREGKADIDKTFLMDTTKETRNLTVQDLSDIGDLAYRYGDDCIQQGAHDKGNQYKAFSIGVLMLAAGYDTSRKDIDLKIADRSGKFARRDTTAHYKTENINMTDK